MVAWKPCGAVCGRPKGKGARRCPCAAPRALSACSGMIRAIVERGDWEGTQHVWSCHECLWEEAAELSHVARERSRALCEDDARTAVARQHTPMTCRRRCAAAAATAAASLRVSPSPPLAPLHSSPTSLRAHTSTDRPPSSSQRLPACTQHREREVPDALPFAETPCTSLPLTRHGPLSHLACTSPLTMPALRCLALLLLVAVLAPTAAARRSLLQPPPVAVGGEPAFVSDAIAVQARLFCWHSHCLLPCAQLDAPALAALVMKPTLAQPPASTLAGPHRRRLCRSRGPGGRGE